jgi:photosystem II stability/assembly factor-like uncharacterized protein
VRWLTRERATGPSVSSRPWPTRLGRVAVAGVAVALIGGLSLPSALAAQKEPALAGRSWAQVASFVGVTNVWGLSCPSAATCELVGDFNSAGIAMRTTNDGGSWSSQPLPPGISELKAVSCRSTSVCVALGVYTYADGGGAVAIHTTNGGATWVAKKVPAGFKEPTAISCSTASSCEGFGTGPSGYSGETTHTSDGGTTWVNRSLPGVSQALSVSCPSPSTCEGVGLNNRDYSMTLRTSNGGSTWSAKTLPITEAQYLGSVLCRSGTVCQAAGTTQAGPVVIRTTNGGVSWKPETMPPNLSDGYITSLSCPSASVCTAIDPSGFMRTTNSGTKWSQEALITGVSSPNVLSCPSASTCVAAATGSAGPVSLHTMDAGVKWVSEAFPTGLSQLGAITCRSTSVCEGGGVGGAVRTTNGGASWAEQPIGAYDAYAIDVVACSSIAVCEAGEGTASSVLSTTNGGTTWVAATTFPPSLGRAPFSGLACLTASFCLGTMYLGESSAILRTTDGGKIWVNVGSPLAAKEILTGLACPSASVCEAVGEVDSTSGGAVAIRTTDGGLKWTGGARFPSNIAGLTGVACPTTTTCEAVGSSFTYTSGYSVLACPGSRTCPEASGSASKPSYPYALRTTDGGARWVGTKIPTSTGFLSAIACPTPSICEAVGAHAASASAPSVSPGPAAARSTDGGTTWASQPVPADVATLKAVACPSPYDCYAVGYNPTGGLVLRLS